MATDAPALRATRDSEWIWFAHLLRGPACLFVVLYHLGFSYTREPELIAGIARYRQPGPRVDVAWDPISDLCNRIDISPGMLGLTVLFLVSGFVIPMSLDRRGVRYFAIRRVFRIYPALAACLGVVLLTLWVQSRNGGLAVGVSPVDVFWNATLFAPYAGVRWIEPAAWTLAVEELFYATAALMAWRGWLHRPGGVVGICAVTTALGVMPVSSASSAFAFWFVFNLAFVPFIFIGTAIYQLWRGAWSARQATVVGAVLFGLFVVSLYGGPNDFQATVYSRTAVVGLAIFLLAKRFNSRLPYHRLLDTFSAISYPIYLLHGVMGYVILHAVHHAAGNYYLALAVTLVAVLAVALVVHHVVEAPSMRFGRRLAVRRADLTPPKSARPDAPA